MAVDGSFRVDVEFKRFLDRCPELKSIPKLSNLLQEGENVTEEKVVHGVGELVLHPHYTIPLLGCLRPIASKILDRTVELLRMVPNLRQDDDSYMEEFDEDSFLGECVEGSVDIEQVADIVNVYVRKEKGLRLHEISCLAFARALDLMPSLSGSILNHLNVAPAPFHRILQRDSVSKALAMGANQLLHVVRASYLFLIVEPEVFTMWDWSCFLDIVRQFKELPILSTAETSDIVSEIRSCSERILSVVLKMSKVYADLDLDPKDAPQHFLRWTEFSRDVSLEKAGWYLKPDEETRSLVDGGAILEEGPCLKPCRLNSLPMWKRNSGDPFILTSAVAKSFEMVTLFVSQRWPVLLYGPAGSGKTALIQKLSLVHGRRVLCIHLDEQIDGKTLTGTYVSADNAGEFRWQPGSLSQAVLHGFWVVFEDIDKAPPDILSILLPLLDGASTFSTGHGEAIRVHEGFRLLSTMTSSNSDISRFTGGKSSLGSLGAVWRKVMIKPPSKEDLLNIVLAWYKELKALAEKLIETYLRVNQITGFQFGSTPSGYSDRFTSRDLLKLCKRVASFGFSLDLCGSFYACSSIYKEAIDVFASFSTSAENRLAIMKEIAKIWCPVSAVDTLYPNKPIIQEKKYWFQVGRVHFDCAGMGFSPGHKPKPFVELRSSVCALERIANSYKFNEPVLLVGETGTGKTTLVQTLATRLGQKLTVLNLSQQSDVADLVGGFKPLDAGCVCIPLYREFEILFNDTFSSKDNGMFLAQLKKFLCDKNWKMLLSGFQKGVRKIVDIGQLSPSKKRKRPLKEQLLKSWENFSIRLEKARAQISASNGMVFSFVEGAFVTALRNGEWILLDEVNLAPPEILQRINGVLEDEKGSLCLSERGDIDYVERHPNFRVFACMNPATDAGKRDLQFSLRSRFTEYFVDDVLDDEDLTLFIKQFVGDGAISGNLVDKIVQFYKAAKESEERLQDGANQKPHYSLRSLYRALEYLRLAKRTSNFEKDLYDGFCLFFQSQLDDSSVKLMNKIICKYLLEGKAPPLLPVDSSLKSKADNVPGNYVITESVKKHLENLKRAISVGRYPVLLQGPTSSGKTSLVRFLAAESQREFVRINNHEHTDLQEYLGSYITDETGKLVFQEGALVKAVRNGHWIVLDELNLAPSDVLEALNRLLDDNREIFVPELRETIRAHPNFMLFATQNPPVVYGGRKILSRAFRNRFVEIHVEEIPQEELSTILRDKCAIPESSAKKMVDVMNELQMRRQNSKIFAGKHGFITPRDLFRWADRFRAFEGKYDDLARDGYYLIAERLRNDAEKAIVKEVLESKLRVKPFEHGIYKQEENGEDNDWMNKLQLVDDDRIGKIIWTETMWRMFFLVQRCYKMREPVLLVGETGGGKTTICQLLSIMLGSKLHVLNCHQYTETSDFVGGFYPVRDRLKISKDFQNLCNVVNDSKAFKHFPGDKNIISDINQASQTLHVISVIIKSYKEQLISHPEITSNDIDDMEKLYLDMSQLQQKWQTIFMWQDGPLVEAMKKGDLLLVDEISLADDSVLERLNSVLEPERKLSLAEKGGSDLEVVKADENFFLLATMNPGGDYGKKELSPALRNRFTEIWVPSADNIDDLRSIALGRILNPGLSEIVNVMLEFWEWFNSLETGRALTVRDLLSWVSFVNVLERSLSAESAFIHGAFLVLLDGLSLGTSISKADAAALRMKCFSFLLEKLKDGMQTNDLSSTSRLESYGWEDPRSFAVLSDADYMECDNLFGIHPFYIEKGADQIYTEGFEFRAPTTRKNAMRVLRAMQLNKPVLLEGSPGVGKTSLVENLGKYSGHAVVRINLSEQTDIMDLLGSDLPVESDGGIQFAWSDGILLQALKNGSWVLLDELNLAPQSVLEGLNAILDHRAEVFIPELGRSFKCPSAFRVFACQNPSHQGGGRKGLPKSFLNRFTKVYVDELVDEDYLSICMSKFPSIEIPLLQKLILFNKRLHQETMVHHKFGQNGSPWEFNLRDVYRSCEIIKGVPGQSISGSFLNTVYIQRMRTGADRVQVMKLYEEVFGEKPFINPYPGLQLYPHSLVINDVSVERYRYQSCRKSNNNLKILPGLHLCLEAVAQCVKNQWLCILVGPPSSGKTSTIRLLAEMTGNVLNELNLSSTTDISELLGSFEQYNASRHYQRVVTQVERYLNEYCDLQFKSFSTLSSRTENLIAQWLAFKSNASNGLSSASDATNHDESPRIRNSAPKLIRIIECLRMAIHEHTLSISWSGKDLDSILCTLRNLKDLNIKQHSVKFEWVIGVMVKAIENGEWIVLENANLCNPTVLDRLNSLVEQYGSIAINECGTVDGKPVVLHPDSKFRIFLTVNPSFGEVSRAMRNRGVEIYMMQPYWLLEESENNDDIELREVKRFITLSGIPVSKLVDMMARAHISARQEGSRVDVTITYLELTRWVQLFQQLITNGNRPAWSIQISFEHTYLSSFGEEKGKDIVSQATALYLTSELYKFTSPEDRLLTLPGGWPSPLNLREYVYHSIEACVRKNCMYLESLGSLIASQEKRGPKGQTSRAGYLKKIYLMDVVSLQKLMFPTTSCDTLADKNRSEMDIAEKKLTFSAEWVIEQASASDYWLYIRWFEWFGSQLEPSVSFLNWFADLLKTILSSNHNSTNEVINLSPSAGVLSSCHSLLLKSSSFVGLLRHSFQQWNSETQYSPNVETQSLKPIFTCLRRLEEKVIDLLAKSHFIEDLFRTYNGLLDNHMLFWRSISSHQKMRNDYLKTPRSLIPGAEAKVFWRLLIKDVLKLEAVCPEEVKLFKIVVSKLDGVSSVCSSTSLLWKHGGHPFPPSSSGLYEKQRQLSNLCEIVWPRKSKLWKLDENKSVDAALSSHMELRYLAMEACMSSYITGDADFTSHNSILQLDDMYQSFVRRLDIEKRKLENGKHACRSELRSMCCTFTPTILSVEPAYEFWLMTQPINDETSVFLDLELLQQPTKIFTIDTERQAMKSCLKQSVDFSMQYSSRPPTDFQPHQKLLWSIDAWSSVNGAKEKISSSVMEMWFRWHETLWDTCPKLAETFQENGAAGIRSPKLFRPQKLIVVDDILHSSNAVNDHLLHSFKLRAASCNIWRSSGCVTDLHDKLLSAARSLFQQIVSAHKKSFQDSEYTGIRMAFTSLHEAMDQMEYMKALIVHLASSDHQIFKSLVDSYIEPLLFDLYPKKSSDDIWHSIGSAFLRIGSMRYNLLICCDSLDPTEKYSIMYSALTEKIASLKIEIEVHEECAYLAGTTHVKGIGEYKLMMLEKLESEKERLQNKMVYRSTPGKVKDLKHVCDGFLESVMAVGKWINDVKKMQKEDVINKVHNWQKTTAAFIDRLSSEYSEYMDIIEPVQIAIYEIKLGLSLVESSLLSKTHLRDEEVNMELFLGTMYEFIRFPRGCVSKTVSFKFENLPRLSTCDIDLPTSIECLDKNLVQKMIGLKTENMSDSKASNLQIKISVYSNVLARARDAVADACFLSDSTFEYLHEIFGEVANLSMKHRVKAVEESTFTLKKREFNIDSIMPVDVSDLDSMSREMQEDEPDENGNHEIDEAEKALELVWKAQESYLDNIISIHNQFFGSVDLVQLQSDQLGSFHVSDKDRLLSFLGSYGLGAPLLRDLEGPSIASFDGKIAPEHLLRLCLEHDHKFILSQRSNSSYNFYKDSNAPVMAQLVDLVTALKNKIMFLLIEWDGHYALQGLREVIDRVLALPLDSPLAKALSMLKFLLSQVRSVQETVAKFPLSNELKPIYGLVSSWYKLEFESWPTLLDEVQSQFERNAGKLWFPLFSILQRNHTPGIVEEYNRSTTESLEEFFKTSCIGEFRKQLQLLLSFHGHLSNLNRRSNASRCDMDTLNILYNTCGFYIQWLPQVMEYVGASRRSIEKKLEELLKLCRWDRVDNQHDIENLKTRRAKLKTLIKQYTDALQQPLVQFVSQEVSRSGLDFQLTVYSTVMVDSFKATKDILDLVRTQACEEDSFKWLADWWNGLESKGGVIDGIRDSSPAQAPSLPYLEERKQMCYTIKDLCEKLINCGELWEGKSKKSVKHRVLTDLLKFLDNLGLSKHRTSVKFDKVSWRLQPSYKVQHLLQTSNDCSSGNVHVGLSGVMSSSPEIAWKTANVYYFKSIHSVQCLEEICLNFHRDILLEQVKRSCSYVDHLIEIQQELRFFAYKFEDQLECLKQPMRLLSNLLLCEENEAQEHSSAVQCSLVNNQDAIFKCMWEQKQLLDAFCATLYEEMLLVQTVENNHLNACEIVEPNAKEFRLFLQKFLPEFKNAKNNLDHHLLGRNEVISSAAMLLPPYGVTRKMEELVIQNFELIAHFEMDLLTFKGKYDLEGGIEHNLLGRFGDLLAKTKIAEKQNLQTNSNGMNWSSADARKDYISSLKSRFNDVLKETHDLIVDTLQRAASLKNDSAFTEESLKNIKEWKILFERDRENLQLDRVCDGVTNIIQSVVEIFKYCGSESSDIYSSVYEPLGDLYLLLKKLVVFGESFMRDFLVTHRMVSIMTCALANIFASLFANGYGTIEEEDDCSSKEFTQDANGTGMGEGHGLNDVSDQLEDEDQLLGSSDRPNEEQDAKSDQQGKSEKGIEMEQDFDAEALSVSEDSGDEEDEADQEEQLESELGNVGKEGEVADEKLDGMDDKDDESCFENEKYEHGPSVKENSGHDEELRAKEDSVEADVADSGDRDAKESTENNDENGDEDNSDGVEDMSIDKADASVDFSGINPEERNPTSDELTDMNEMVDDLVEDGEPEDLDGSELKDDEDENAMDEGETEDAETTNGEGSLPENNNETDAKVPKEDVLRSTTDSTSQNDQTSSSGQHIDISNAVADMGLSAQENSSDFSEQDGIAPASSVPNAPELEVKVSGSRSGQISSREQSNNSLPPSKPLIRKPELNPCRSIGDALEAWKERVNVTADIENQESSLDDLMDENADEYGYTVELKKGTDQALGPATADQTRENTCKNDNEGDARDSDKKDTSTEADNVERTSENVSTRNSALTHVKDVVKLPEVSDMEKQIEESMEVDACNNRDLTWSSETLVSVNRSFMREDIHRVKELALSDDELAKSAEEGFDLSRDKRNDAADLWRSYESSTTRLSQELAEKLRLILEPTSASKLQGDYKTGKRINMRKVIPYVASQFRKDKIWMRRTRPSKRDYRVTIAVDDSRSMSEGRCGNFAIEALLTVCRAMSQLEVGNFAVVSFGKQGNIRLLHDFDQHITPEDGIQMISSLTFKQETTIMEEPMLELLNYLDNMMDSSVARARLPSGDNPLQQLVLIIADGRFSEKEKLKRRVRDLLNKNCMVAFLVLDNANESIVGFQEATLQGTEVKFSKYLDTFPFPYYAILRNIDALPSTLGDLLRQWFELMLNGK